MKTKRYWVYIMANRTKVIYVGVTNDLMRRVYEHKEKMNSSGFTAKYHLSKLVYFEETNDISVAIGREKQLKRYKRKWKVDIIEKENPEWEDLSEGWYE